MDTNIFMIISQWFSLLYVHINITIAYDGWKQDSKLGYHSAKYKGVENEIT
jgi:hypothetical protein